MSWRPTSATSCSRSTSTSACWPQAREGAFGATDMRNVTPARRQRWFTEEKVDGVIRWKASRSCAP
ncbi:MAG: hypothetical protein U0Y82_07480 [Thermoleophilia bacterium]